MPLIPNEDIAEQQENLKLARAALSIALATLAHEAKIAAKSASSKHGSIDLDAVYAASRAVERAEETVDLAALDVHTASGHDI